MLRHQPTTILRGQLRSTKLHGYTVYADDKHIYTEQFDLDVVMIVYTHSSADYIKRIAVHAHPDSDKSRTRFASISHNGSPMFITDSMAFTIGSDKRFARNFDTPTKLRAFVYHPGRSTYLAVFKRSDIVEFDTDFNITQRIPCSAAIEAATVLPSTCSTNAYIGWRAGGSIGLSIVQNHCATPFTDYAHSNPVLLMRPGLSDIMTMTYDNTIAMIDVWHTSSVVRSRYISASLYGVYIDPNTCITSGGNELAIFDHRYGSVGNIYFENGVANMWHVGTRLYAAGRRDTLYVLDV